MPDNYGQSEMGGGDYERRRRVEEEMRWDSSEQRLLYYLSCQEGMSISIDEPDYSKVCDVEYGMWVQIIWDGAYYGGDPDEVIVDEGYVFGWPSHEDRDANMAGVVHVPNPQNPGGKDEPPMEWVTLHELRTNPMVKQVRKLPEPRAYRIKGPLDFKTAKPSRRPR